MVARGEVRWLELEDEGRRPVVVLTRDEALSKLKNVVVALVTRTTRGIPTEVEIGPEDEHEQKRAPAIGGQELWAAAGTEAHDAVAAVNRGRALDSPQEGPHPRAR